jgi:uncharacterized RDD family membrane protein YckC
MRTIEISTTQNVTIEYELGSVRDRGAAFAIDFVIIWGSIFILEIIWSIIALHSAQMYLMYFTVLGVFFFYTLFMEIFGNGRSVGKRALGLKVVKIDGTEASVSDYLIRWTFRMVDIYFSVGSVAALLISSTDKSQRLGDMIANTTVIRVKPKNNLLLKDIMKISSLQNYEPHFPAVRQIPEADMLLVKNVLDRYKKYPNASHKEALRKTVNIMMERLHVDEPQKDSITFLRTLINDYIVLTR